MAASGKAGKGATGKVQYSVPNPKAEANTEGSSHENFVAVDQITTPKPRVFKDLAYEHAHMLATMPRRKVTELYDGAAFGGAVAALPSALDAFVAACRRSPFAVEWFELLQILIFFGFTLWFVIKILGRVGQQTSGEYLAELVKKGIVQPNSTTSNPGAATDTPQPQGTG